MTATWVASRLGVRLVDGERPVGVGLTDLVGLAVRRNPRRAHLLVSRVLGKHLPTDPRLVHGAGLLLGDLVRQRLQNAPVAPYGPEFAEALRGVAVPLRDRLRASQPPVEAIVLGYAETATALGQSVADALGGAHYLHSTRRRVGGFAVYGGFEEEHSHATGHLLLPRSAAELDRDLPMVLVDDEVSTGRTVLNTIRASHALRPRDQYVVAALVDLRGPRDRARTQALARELGTRIDAVSLATGSVELPDDILTTGQALVARLSDQVQAPPRGPVGDVTYVDLRWPSGLPDGGRHGFLPEHRFLLEKALPPMAERVAAHLTPGSRILVLGCEELMYTPLRLAETLADRGLDVRYSTTTRSPVLPVDDPGYAIRTRLAFPAHDGESGERYAYNVAGDTIVLLVDDTADTPALAHGLVRELTTLAPVVMATIPSAGRQETT